MARIIVAYAPFPVNIGFHATAVREKALIGAVGSGKTVALCADALIFGLEQAGSSILIARQSVPSLKITTEHEFLNLLSRSSDPDTGKSLYDVSHITRTGGHTDILTLPNGTEYFFRSLDDWKKLMSLNLAAFYVDEASEISYESYLGLLTRLRQREPTPMAARQGASIIKRQQAAIATNPNGHDWIWEHWIHNPPTMLESDDPKTREAARQRKHFRSTSFDNPTLYNEDGSPGPYLESLMTMPPMWIKRYVMCQHDAFSGQIYNFHPDLNVHTHFDPPKNWIRASGLDWGLRNPTAVVWWAQDPDDRKWYQYREWQSYNPTDQIQRESYVTMNVHEIATAIKRIEAGETIRYRVADPAIAQRTADNGKSVQYWFSHYGMHYDLGMKKYEDRINALNQLFTQRQLSVSDSCMMTSIGIQQYRWADLPAGRDVDGPEKPVKKNDHLVNACEYLATKFMTPGPPKQEKHQYTLSRDIQDTIKRQLHKKRAKGVL